MTDSQLLFLIGNLWAVAGIALDKNLPILIGGLLILLSVITGLGRK